MTVKPEDIQLSPGQQRVLIPRLWERVLSCHIGRSALDYPTRQTHTVVEWRK